MKELSGLKPGGGDIYKQRDYILRDQTQQTACLG